MSFDRLIFGFFVVLALGCGNVSDDLFPSGDDKRPSVVEGSTGTSVGQVSPDFTVQDSLANPVTLSTELNGSSGVVLYFTMWCPICDSHMSYIRSNIRPNFSSVQFFLVDYVTGTVSACRSAQISNGYTDFTVLVDTGQSLLDRYNATMGTTVVIDSFGVVQMNEDFKDGSKLIDVLESLT
jgi:peroxiredoxin